MKTNYQEVLTNFGRPVSTSELAAHLGLCKSSLARTLRNVKGVSMVGHRMTATGRPEYLWSLGGESATITTSQSTRSSVQAALPGTVSEIMRKTGKSRASVLHHLSKLGAHPDDRHYPTIWRL